MKNNLLLKNVYSNLIYEAILDQSTFIEKILKFAERKTDIEKNKHGKITASIIKSINDTKLLDLKGKENKKARKKAEIQLTKDLKEIKGIDGTAIDIKGIRPLYDSIVQYLLNKNDISLDDCIIAADYYMKDFYPYADNDEKKIIDKGSFDFGIIFERTKFYQQYLEFKKEKMATNSSYNIYEDENIIIVYPTNPDSFNYFIKQTESVVDWCTQSPSTWYNYNQDQYVMILHNKKAKIGDETYLVSLKVDFSGNILYRDTCDYYNYHLTGRLDIITPDIESEIKRYVINNVIKTDTFVELHEVKSYLKGLIDVNNFDQIKNFYNIFINQNKRDHFDGVTRKLFDLCNYSNKYDLAINLLTEVFADSFFEHLDTFGQEFYPITVVEESVGAKGVLDILQALLIKAIEKRSHEKYFISFNCMIDSDTSYLSNLIQISNFESKFKTAFINACNTNNPINFKLVLYVTNLSEDLKSIVMSDDLDDVDIFKTSGFFNYAIDRKLNLLVPQNIGITNNTIEDYYESKSDEKYIRDLILKNKEEFSLIFEKNKRNKINSLTKKINNQEKDLYENEVDNIKKSIKQIQSLDLTDIDTNVIISYIINTKNIEEIDISKILENVMFLDEISVTNIVNKFLTDIDTFEFLYEKNDQVGDRYLKFIADFGEKSSVLSLKSFEIIEFVLEKIMLSKKFVNYKVKANKDNFKMLLNIFHLFKKFNLSFEKMQNVIKEFILEISIKDQGFVHYIMNDFKRASNFLREYNFFREIINFTTDSDLKNVIYGIESYINQNKIFYFERNKISNSSVINTAFKKITTEKKIVDKINKTTKINNTKEFFLMFYYASLDLLDKYNIANLTKVYIEETKKSNSSFFNFDAKPIKPLLAKIISNSNEKNEIISVIHDNFDIFSFYTGGSLSNPNVFKTLVINSILSAENNNMSFNKKILADIINHRLFFNIPEDVGLKIIKNLVTLSSDNERNYLFSKDLVIVRDCLSRFFKQNEDKRNIENYRNEIFNMIKGLNRNARIQISDFAFRGQRKILHAKTENELSDTFESLLRQYLLLLIN